MPLMHNKKSAVDVILAKMKGASTSEHSSESMKESNEAAAHALTPINEAGDEINAGTAIDAAAQSAMQAVEAKDPVAFKTAIFDMFQLFEMTDERTESED